jgi:hypothetical protein
MLIVWSTRLVLPYFLMINGNFRAYNSPAHYNNGVKVFDGGIRISAPECNTLDALEIFARLRALSLSHTIYLLE